jgi:DNA-binding transcriptional MerR regulator
MTGLRPELLRMWEKRYRLFSPPRAGNRYREFDDEDVQVLLYICQHIKQGRTIGELAAEGRAAILRQIAAESAPEPPPRQDYTVLIEELLGYLQQLDRRRLEARLAECAVLYSFTTLLTAVVAPLMHRLGALWGSRSCSRNGC